MPKSKAEKLRNLATKRQIITAADAAQLGVPRTYLSRLARRGQLEKIARGLYTSPAFSPSEHASLVEASYQVPKGVICLLSASDFTTSLPNLRAKCGSPSATRPGLPKSRLR
jgi:predicted transcriptional regulator of viral defense system